MPIENFWFMYMQISQFPYSSFSFKSLELEILYVIFYCYFWSLKNWIYSDNESPRGFACTLESENWDKNDHLEPWLMMVGKQ